MDEQHAIASRTENGQGVLDRLNPVHVRRRLRAPELARRTSSRSSARLPRHHRHRRGCSGRRASSSQARREAFRRVRSIACSACWVGVALRLEQRRDVKPEDAMQEESSPHALAAAVRRLDPSCRPSRQIPSGSGHGRRNAQRIVDPPRAVAEQRILVARGERHRHVASAPCGTGGGFEERLDSSRTASPAFT